jgi:alanine-alpha-ketoisovalerate/valine-pyruvate aminotransferase
MLEVRQMEEKRNNASWVMLDEQVEKLDALNDTKVIPLDLTKFKDLPFEIIFHPQSFDWHRKNIKKIIDKFELKYSTTESALKDIFK